MFSSSALLAQNSPFVFKPDSPLTQSETTVNRIVVADLDQNGYDDIVLFPSSGFPNSFFFSPDSGKFYQLRAPKLPLSRVSNYGSAIVTQMEEQDRPILTLNYNQNDTLSLFKVADTSFVSIRRSGALQTYERSAINALAIADFDGDSRLDALWGSNTGSRSLLDYYLDNFLSQGDRSFTFNSNTELTLQSAATSSYSLSDFNNDGAVDALRLVTFGAKQKLFLNTNGEMLDQLGSSLSVSDYTNGALTYDFNNDGFIDVYMMHDLNVRNSFFRGSENAEFTKVGIGAPTLDQKRSYGASAGDFDNDGDLDIVVADRLSTVSIYRNEGNELFSKLTLDVLPIEAEWRHAVLLDADQNGQLDLLTGSITGNFASRFYENAGNQNSWIGFKLESTNGFFPEAYGARITLTATISGEERSQIREVFPTNGYNNYSSRNQHFGLADATSATAIIRWPSGFTQTVEFNSSELNQYHSIVEPEAGKMSALSSVVLSSISGVAVQDTILVQNVGKATITIDSVFTEKANLSVVSFTEEIPTEGTGNLVVRYLPRNEDGFVLTQHLLTVFSDAVNDRYQVAFQTRNIGQGAPFVQAKSNNDVFFETSAVMESAIYGDLIPEEESTPELMMFDQFSSHFGFEVIDSIRFVPLNDDLIDGSLNPQLTSATVTDFNIDGLPDLFLAFRQSPNIALLNIGSSYRVSSVGQINRNTNSSVHTLSRDFDRDGLLDVSVLSGDGQINELYRNISGSIRRVLEGNFTSVTSNALHHSFLDLDGDGLEDFLVARDSDFGEGGFDVFLQTAAFRFEQASFSPFTGLQGSFKASLAVDLDNDTDLDLILLSDTPNEKNRIFYNDEFEWKERNSASESMSLIPGNASDVITIDYNLDGWQDLYVTYEGFFVDNQLMLSVNGTSFTPIGAGEIAEFSEVQTRTAMLTDSNMDGVPDILSINIDAPSALFINSLPIENTENNWIGVVPKLEFPDGTQHLIPGTLVQLETEVPNGHLTQTRILGQHSIFSQNVDAVYFGTDTASSGTLRIIAPNGESLEQNILIDRRRSTFTLNLTKVNTEEEIDLPTETRLRSAFPNPFNPQTLITFDLREAGFVNLELYDMLGRKVSQLQRGRLSAGTHQVAVDASKLSSGVYIAILRSGAVVSSLKLTLIK